MTVSPPYAIEVQRDPGQHAGASDERLYAAAAWVLRAYDMPPATGLSIVITDDETIRALNRQYRAVDAPTDVLSFPAVPDTAAGEDADYLGDLVLALPTIQRQAAAEGHTVEDEMVLAVVHGTLHLLGYDHDTVGNQRAMWAAQADALRALGVAIVVPLFDLPDDEMGQVGSPE